MSAFENFGKRETVSDDDQMECGICWHVYDPAEGDPVWQIAPGTSFADLPVDWRCPNCDALQSKFMRLVDGR
ncbi:rubredoxin [Mesorhizobium erdmanii]|uniref:Rubredoxin n=2 Tax=Mesorhizobium TaxID=68287 RepID=A0A3M9X4X7_9HYPH|nr:MULTISPECIES: rubredoxin [Mesorhizobium]RNJ42746.1 rubredoxin [Mesorhizobium japonicum]RXT42612.1 rubredoxin [Mesorhizobium erdmanii]